MAADATFREVLEVTVDITKFRTGLRALEREYNAFITRVGVQNAGAIFNVGSFSGLQSGVGKIATQVEQLDKELVKSLDNLDSRIGKMSQRRIKAENAAGAARLKQNTRINNVLASGVQQTTTAWGRFTRKLTTNIPELTATIIRYTIAFAAFRVILQSIAAAMKAIFIDPFVEGFKFLSKVEERTADIKEALIASVIASDDTAENFERLGSLAHFASERILDLAGKFNIDPEKLEAGLKAFITAGGLQLVSGGKDAQETIETSLELVGKLNSVLRASGVNATNQRRFIRAITQLVKGQATEQNVLLRVLNFSRDEWRKIVLEAREAGNLVELISKSLEASSHRLETADERMAELVEQTGLLRDAVYGTIATPLWDVFITILQNVKGFLIENKEAIATGAYLFGSMVANLFKALPTGELLLATLRATIAVISAIVGAIVLVANLLGGIGDTILFIANAYSKFLTGDFVGAFKEGEKFIDRIGERTLLAFDSTKKALQLSVGALTGSFDGIVSDDDQKTANETYTLLNIPPREDSEEDPLAELRTRLSQGLDEIRDDVNDKRDVITEDFNKFRISRQDMLIRLTELNVEEAKRNGEFLREIGAQATLEATFATGDASVVRKFSKLAETIENRRRDLTAKSKKLSSKQEQDAITFFKKLALDQFKFEKKFEQQKSDAILSIRRAGNAKESDLLAEEAESVQKNADIHNEILDREFIEFANREDQRQRITQERLILDNKTTTQIAILSLQRIDALEEEARAMEDLEERVRSLDAAEGVRSGRRAALGGETPRERAERELATAVAANQRAGQDVFTAQDRLGRAEDTGTEAEVQEARIAVKEAMSALADTTVTVEERWQAVAQSASNLINAFDTVVSFFESLSASFKEGGIVSLFENITGKIGKLLSVGPEGISKQFGEIFGSEGFLGKIGGGFAKAFTKVADAIPGIGAALQIGAAVFSFVRGIMTSAARKIAGEIRESMKKITESFQAGTTTLAATIEALQQERADAVRRLTGEKGGQKELKKLLPELDKQLESLLKQQEQIITSFEESLHILRLDSDPLAGFLKKWQEINKQVSEYIDAGGDIASAQEFLSRSLEGIREENIRALQQAEESAIRDVIRLNGLLEQRIDLVEEFKRTEFDLINGNAIERAAAPAVVAGLELQKRREEFAERLSQLDSEIQVMTLRVEKEREVFDLASDTADLRARANELDLLFLDQQIERWHDIQRIIDGIVQNGYGTFTALDSITGGFGGINVGTINITINGADSDDLADDLVGEILEGLEDAARTGSHPA